jgi:von Willebrand factor A domain-containing protein 5
VEAVYCFPIEEQAAVYAFSARIDDREITAQLKEKQEARKEYSDALQQGHGATLLEQDEKSQDNFIISVGALPAGKECHISISYVTELNAVQNGQTIRFVVPTTIAPRYNPEKGDITGPAQTTSKYVQKTSYTIQFHCEVDRTGVARVSSSSHPIQVDLSKTDCFIVEFAQDHTHLDRDILLDIDRNDTQGNTIVVVENGAVMAAFMPNEDDCHRAINGDMTNEFIFVVDCSGSMEHESKISSARQALLLFLKSLPVGCPFNIIRFGSRHEKLFDEITKTYTEETLRKAEDYAKHMHADLGGTELVCFFDDELALQPHSCFFSS